METNSAIKRYDLGALAAAIPSGSKPREQFKAAVRAVRGAAAEEIDLAKVLTNLKLLGALDMQDAVEAGTANFKQDPDNSDLAHALYLSAIILYVRATERRSLNKPKPDYEAGFTEEQRADHTYLMRLRDDALAHWGEGVDRLGRPHSSITFVLELTPVGAIGRTSSQLVNYLADVVNKLGANATAAHSIAQAKVVAASALAAERFAALQLAEPDLTVPEFQMGQFFAAEEVLGVAETERHFRTGTPHSVRLNGLSTWGQGATIPRAP